MAGLYVALGDSMSIDDYAGGAGRGAASLLHRNHDGDFPEWSGRDLATAGLSARILARDGATAEDVLARQLPAMNGSPALVTLTVGGNDLLLTYGDAAAARAAIDRVVEVGETILSRLTSLSGCQVVVSTVYDPSDGTGAVPSSGLPPWPQGVAAVNDLNTALTDLAGRHGAVVADVHGRFHGHGVLAGDPAGSEARPANRDLWYCGVIEPNAWGADGIRASWWTALAEAGWRPP